jgi:hypothetical protein
LVNRQHLREGRREDRARRPLQVVPANTLNVGRSGAITGEEHPKVADCGFAGGDFDANVGGNPSKDDAVDDAPRRISSRSVP